MAVEVHSVETLKKYLLNFLGVPTHLKTCLEMVVSVMLSAFQLRAVQEEASWIFQT